MAENGNERYLRYILLLGEGVLLVLRGVVRREVQRTGSTLDVILTIPNNRRQIERNCHSETQRLHLFPSPTTVNSDIETWDISLLTLVIQSVFWSRISSDERVRISYLRDRRNEYQGHPPTMSMEQTDYTTRSADLTNTLQDLATGMDQQTRDKLSRIINDSNAVQFDFHTAIQNLQQLYEFKEEMLRELEAKFQDVNIKLDTMRDESSVHKQMMRDMRALQSHMHGDILDMKSLSEENYRKTIASSKNLEEISSSSREMNDTLRRIEQMMTELMSHQRGRQFQHEVDANININSEKPGNATEAQDVIVTNINDILKEIRPDALEDRDNAESIMQNVNELITRYEGSDYELTKALLEIIKDIIRHGHIQQARKGSIKITVRFTSYRGLLSFVQYLNSEQSKDRLNDIARALRNRTGHVVTLTACIAQESLFDLYKHLEEECDNLTCNKSVVLPVKCKGIIDLNHIWKLLQRGGADRHMERLSEILTKIVGGKITVTTSVDLKQFEQALLETDRFPQKRSGEGSALTKESSADSEKDYERQLKYKYAGEYLPRCRKDRFTPFINGIEVLANGRILLTDGQNCNLKILDSSFNVVSYCDLPGIPLCVSYIGKDTAAVGLRGKFIAFVRVTGYRIIERLLELDYDNDVYSLASYGKTLYIYDNACTVYTSTTDDGHLQGVLYKTQNRGPISWNQCIAISGDGKIIYLLIYLSSGIGLVTIDNKGNCLSTLMSDNLRYPCSVCAVGDGTIFVLDRFSQDVIQVDYGGTKVLKVVGSLPRSEHCAMCYDRKYSRLIAGCQIEKLLVLELQK